MSLPRTFFPPHLSTGPLPRPPRVEQVVPQREPGDGDGLVVVRSLLQPTVLQFQGLLEAFLHPLKTHP